MRLGTTLFALIAHALLAQPVTPALAADCSAETFQNDTAAALEACNLVLSQQTLTDHKRAEALKIRARSLHRLGRLDLAITDYELALSLAPTDPELHVRRGWTAFDKLEVDRAMRFAERALELNPRYASAFDLAGSVIWRAGNLVKALDGFDKAIALEPSEPRFRYHRFQLLEFRAREREALAEADIILGLAASALDQPNVIPYFGKFVSVRTAISLQRALLLSKMGRFDEADKAFNDLVDSAPNALTLARRASYRMFRRAPIELAQSDIDRAMALDSDYWLVHEQMGRAHLQAHRQEAALASYTRAMELNPADGSLRWRRALVLRGLDRVDEAIAEAAAAVERDPDFLQRKLLDLVKRGYLIHQPTPPSKAAIRDAVLACMLDEDCG
jgi:tetratricopeptide (TPR) repeat protein